MVHSGMNPFLKKYRKAISTSRVRRQPFAEGADVTYPTRFIMSHSPNLAFQEVQCSSKMYKIGRTKSKPDVNLMTSESTKLHSC